MPYQLELPDIGEGVVEAEVQRWLVAPGDLVEEDQPLVEVMTDKATVVIPSPRRGRVVRPLFEVETGEATAGARRVPAQEAAREVAALEEPAAAGKGDAGAAAGARPKA